MRTKHREMLEEIMAEAEKKKLQAQLLAVAVASNTEEENEGSADNSEYHTYLPDDVLTESVGQLLTLLVDEATLKSFGWPETAVDELLESVIRYVRAFSLFDTRHNGNLIRVILFIIQTMRSRTGHGRRCSISGLSSRECETFIHRRHRRFCGENFVE